MRTIFVYLAALVLALVVAGCGGNKPYAAIVGTPPGPSISITSPNPNTVVEGGTLQFTAQVSNSTSSVDWTVEDEGGGTIDGTGFYTAPGTAGTYTIKAALHDDPSIFATASAVVVAPGTGGVGGTIQ